MKHLKRKEFDYSIKLLKGFEKKEAEVRDISATNLSSMYFLDNFQTLLKMMYISL